MGAEWREAVLAAVWVALQRVSVEHRLTLYADFDRHEYTVGTGPENTIHIDFLAAAHTAMRVLLTDSGQQKIRCIKEVRGILGSGLKEAKDLVDRAAPTRPQVVAEGLTPNAAANLAELLRSIGATVVVENRATPLFQHLSVERLQNLITELERTDVL